MLYLKESPTIWRLWTFLLVPFIFFYSLNAISLHFSCNYADQFLINNCGIFVFAFTLKAYKLLPHFRMDIHIGLRYSSFPNYKYSDLWRRRWKRRRKWFCARQQERKCGRTIRNNADRARLVVDYDQGLLYHSHAEHKSIPARRHTGNTWAHLTSTSISEIDCFQLPSPNETDKNGPLSVLEVSDPKICILAHLMSPLEALDPLLESPTAHPLMKQRAVALDLISEVQQANSAVGGMLLANMERSNVEFPFIAYYVINTTQTDPGQFYMGVRNTSLVKFEPKNLR